ncbi:MULTISPECIES: RNA polymerase sigma-70 factor [Bacteroides]|uniref:RNA polymerase sigma-70 factor n=1 Tax=Bacteroides TaxID=816 RepID=UPI001D90F323|nr:MULTISPECIES: RNA polymerase sigma-70 factor [Bacteroides]HJD91235.1 RNA polymerase sigma-70 factor [Bacteroides coprosuis]
MIREITPLSIVQEEDFKLIFNQFYPYLFMYAKRFLPKEDSANDVVQEAFIKLWELRRDFQNLQQTQSFLYTCIRNSALNELAHQKVKTKYTESLLAAPPSFDFINDSFIEDETYRLIVEAIHNLPPRMREVMQGYLQGHTPDEIATKLGVTVETVYSQRQLALKKLRSMLGKYALYLPFFFKILNN